MSVNYTRINWEDSPSTQTPLNAENLNAMDSAIDDLAGAVNELDGVPDDIEALESDVGAIKNDFTQLVNNGLINLGSEIHSGRVLNGYNPVQLVPEENSDWVYAIIPAKEGDRFRVSGSGGTSYRPYSFVSGNTAPYTTIEMYSSTDTPAEDLEIVAPANTTYLVFDSRVSYEYSVFKECVPLDALDEKLADINAIIDSAYITETATGAVASFTDGADDIPVKDLTVAIEPVQSGSGDPSPENVRPISGWTGVNVTRTGKNLVNIPTCTIAQAGSVYPLSPLPQALPAGTYTVGITSSAESAWIATFRDAGNNIVGSFASNQTLAGRQTKTATLSATATQVSIYVNAGTTLSDIMFEFGSTASAYEPFVDSDTVSVDWTTEAGTVYGGALDVTTGVLTVDRAMVDMGTLNWELNSQNQPWQYFAIGQNVKSDKLGENLLCSIYTPRDTYTSHIDNSVCTTGNNLIWCCDAEYSTANKLKTALTGQQLVYELATPQTYQLTPEEVSTVLGQNNIFADTGNVTVQYRADTKLYIDKVLNA